MNISFFTTLLKLQSLACSRSVYQTMIAWSKVLISVSANGLNRTQGCQKKKTIKHQIRITKHK